MFAGEGFWECMEILTEALSKNVRYMTKKCYMER
jgi:hypothetical protein